MLTLWIPNCLTLLQPKRKSLRPTGRLTAGSLMTVLKSLLSFTNQRTPSISNTHKHRCTHAYGYGNACISTKHKYTQAFESWTGPGNKMVTEGHPSLQFHSGRAEVDVMRRDKREEQMHDLQITRTQQGSEIEIDSMPNTAPFSQRMPVNILSHLLALEPHGTGTKRYYLCFPKYIYSVYIAKKIQNVHFIKTKLNKWLKSQLWTCWVTFQ